MQYNGMQRRQARKIILFFFFFLIDFEKKRIYNCIQKEQTIKTVRRSEYESRSAAGSPGGIRH